MYFIIICIKYQALDIEFQVIWLALYWRYTCKSYILWFVQRWKLIILSGVIFPQMAENSSPEKTKFEIFSSSSSYLIKQLFHPRLLDMSLW